MSETGKVVEPRSEELPDQPLVSIITPSYNYGSFLGDCLASVRDQDYPNLEHIVMDACSDDTTDSVIESFRGSYRMEAWIEPDDGQADALNKGFARASGDVFAWLNADDYWVSDRVVSEAVASIRKGAAVVTGDGYFVSATGKRLSPHLPPYLARRRAPATVRKDLRRLDPILQPATFWRRSVHQPLRTDMHYAFDWRFFLDVIGEASRLEVADAEWAAYRWHEENKSNDDPAMRRKEIASILASEWGRRSPQYLWATAVYKGFALAESRDDARLKYLVRKANNLMGRLTRYHVFSC